MRTVRRIRLLLLATLLAALPARGLAGESAATGRFVALALSCVHQEYPNKLSHTLRSDADARPPRELTPAFFGCYDWHSAVHGHWLLARALHLQPQAPWAADARTALARSLRPEALSAELEYLRTPGRAAFERPYGLAWLLQLGTELRGWSDPDARRWSAALAPLEDEAAARLAGWLPKLTYPVRSGEHSQTAFALALARDWAVAAGRDSLRQLIDARARAYYLGDRGCPLAFEPSGEDFLSPCLAEADLMRRVLPPDEFARWLGRALPQAGRRGWLSPAVVTDRSDPKLAHLDGLNLSRAWMLEGIASALPARDGRRRALAAAATAHREAALPAVTGEHYEGGHWLGTFALYLTSGAGRAR
jgi:hypothetical protein